MIRKTALRFAAACMVCSTAAASPVVTAIRISQGSKQMLLIDYTLDSPAVVTFDVLTNGVSIGRDLLETFTGDFGLVEAGARRISWDVRTYWPDRKVESMTAKVMAWSLDAPPDYMVVDLVHSNVNWYASEADIPGGTVLRDEYKTTKLVLRRIHARGIPWRMGRKLSETTDGYDSHQKPHEVVLTNDYYMGVFELTQKQYKLITGLDDSAGGPFRYKGHDKNPAGHLFPHLVHRFGDELDRLLKRLFHGAPGGQAVPASSVIWHTLCAMIPTITISRKRPITRFFIPFRVLSR